MGSGGENPAAIQDSRYILEVPLWRRKAEST